MNSDRVPPDTAVQMRKALESIKERPLHPPQRAWAYAHNSTTTRCIVSGSQSGCNSPDAETTPKMRLDMFDIVGFEVSILGLMEMNDEGHDFTRAQLWLS
ncbi:hypothetical protein ARNL5_02015 [Anaerolineae bacterium]|nr:hypothetical protein ARNL5_02015 [Anaerolineae bacterium]